MSLENKRKYREIEGERIKNVEADLAGAKDEKERVKLCLGAIGQLCPEWVPSEVQLGNKLVFLKQRASDTLDKLRARYLATYVIRIQASASSVSNL